MNWREKRNRVIETMLKRSKHRDIIKRRLVLDEFGNKRIDLRGIDPDIVQEISVEYSIRIHKTSFSTVAKNWFFKGMRTGNYLMAGGMLFFIFGEKEVSLKVIETGIMLPFITGGFMGTIEYGMAKLALMALSEDNKIEKK